MKKSTKYILSVLGSIALMTILLWGANKWIESILRNKLESGTPEGSLQYGTLSVNIFTNHGTIDSLTWTSKHNNDTIIFSCENFTIKNFSGFAWLTKDQIIVGKVKVTRPHILIYSQGQDTTRQKFKVKKELSLPKKVKIKELEIRNGSLAAIDWNFYINDPRDAFTISGTLSKITQKGINYFVRPALDMQAEGMIDDVAFNFAGDAEDATGDFRIRYDDFHLYWLNKEGRNKQFFKSAFINLLINNTMRKPVEKKDITVNRPKTKSFWAYLWDMVQEGIRQTII